MIDCSTPAGRGVLTETECLLQDQITRNAQSLSDVQLALSLQETISNNTIWLVLIAAGMAALGHVLGFLAKGGKRRKRMLGLPSGESSQPKPQSSRGRRVVNAFIDLDYLGAFFRMTAALLTLVYAILLVSNYVQQNPG